MAHRLLSDPQQDGWESAEMPIVCETCLGPNPFVRMQRIEYGGTCHISGRPYTVFRWRPGNDARYKKTIICQEVAKAKNVCQVCLLDLEYGLPVQVRDHALGMQDEGLPESDAGKEYALQQMQETGELDVNKYAGTGRPNELLMKLAERRSQPYYKRNQARVCSFFARGECKRGAECPYRHEMPTTGDLANQNIKDRYYGVNDPVAKKMLSKVGPNDGKLTPPEDSTICTLFVGGVTPEISEDDIRDKFYSYGELRSVKKVDSRSCAFVTYATREAAERAAEALAGQLYIKDEKLKLLWGKPQAQRGGGPPGAPSSGEGDPSSSGAGGEMAFPPVAPQPGGRMSYPSMDPSAMGSYVQRPQDGGPRGPPPPRMVPLPMRPPPPRV